MSATSNPDRRRQRPHGQRGILLLELLVGVTIGLVVVAAATGVVVLSRSTATTVTELSQLHQQGAYALRVIGQYVRQAGTRDIRASATTGRFSFSEVFDGIDGQGAFIAGQEGRNGRPDELSVSHQRASGLPETAQPDCLGGFATPDIDSTFLLSDHALRCRPVNQAHQMTDSAVDFQVRYRVTTSAGTQSMDAAQVDAAAAWAAVSAVEVCLDLQGDDPGHPDSGSYATCRRDDAGRFERAARNGRLHVVLRQVFDLRTREGQP